MKQHPSIWILICILQAGSGVAAEVAVTAGVDRNQIAFGESFDYSINVEGSAGGINPIIPHVDGLNFDGPSKQFRSTFVNGISSQSLQFTYRVTPNRIGEFTIPGIKVIVNNIEYLTQPIRVVVQQGKAESDWSKMLFGKIQIPTNRLYVGQTAQVDIEIYSRQDVPLKGFSGFQCPENELGYRHLENLEPNVRVLNGETFTVYRLSGSVNPSVAGVFMLGPCVVKSQITVQNQRRRRLDSWMDDPFFGDVFGRVEIREIPVTIDALSVEVQPLPDEGRPENFGGAVGQWNLEVTAKPTEVSLGDPITLTVNISGNGNIDTVPMPQLNGFESFKTYDPTSKTTNNTLRTIGSRESQQVLIPTDPQVTEIPEIRLPYFDPIAEIYKTAVQGPIQIAVKNIDGAEPAILSADNRVRRSEKIGEDIVYLKGNLGTPSAQYSFHRTFAFWILNIVPVLSLLGFAGWKRRVERLRGDVAYARRTKAAKRARGQLATAHNYQDIQKTLQQYLGDRLNLPISGITAEVVDAYLVPRGVSTDLSDRVRKCFVVCDNARFAGGDMNNENHFVVKAQLEEIIDALEKENL